MSDRSSRGEPVLELSGVQHAYGANVALRGLDLTVHPGEVVALTGPSGSGKSTVLHLAAGLIPVQAGRAQVLGHDLGTTPGDDLARLRRTRIGVVLQYGQLVGELDVLDNVALPLLLEGSAPDDARGLARDWLTNCGVGECAPMLPAELSGGQAQRVAVARALVTSPHLVLADEPTGSLDAVAGRDVLGLLSSRVRDAGAALLIITHDHVVAASADREVQIVDGRANASAVLR